MKTKKNIIHAMFIISIIFLGFRYCFEQKQAMAQEFTKKETLKGLYGTYPIIEPSEQKTIDKRDSLSTSQIARFEQEKDSLTKKIIAIADADTFSIRRHATLLGGLFTIPALTVKEKELLDKRKKLRKEINIAEKRSEYISNKLNKLKEEKKNIENLRQKHEQYLEKRIFWGFITWEIKKK